MSGSNPAQHGQKWMLGSNPASMNREAIETGIKLEVKPACEYTLLRGAKKSLEGKFI